MAKNIKKVTDAPTEKIDKKPDGEWISAFRTMIEDASGEQYMAEIQQNTATKDIRTVRV